MISMGSMDTPGPVRNAESDTLLNELMIAMMQADAMPDLMFGITMVALYIKTLLSLCTITMPV